MTDILYFTINKTMICLINSADHAHNQDDLIDLHKIDIYSQFPIS